MKKLGGNVIKKNIAVFISGRGSNLKSIIRHSKKKDASYEVKIVISNKRDAKGLIIAKKYKITHFVCNPTKSRKLGKIILKKLQKYNVNLICLAGFMKILPEYFIKSFKGKIINIHPSLLPKYKGLNTHQRVLLNNEKFSGCTVHYVNKFLDSGKNILQKKVRIKKNETAKSLEKKILRIEHKIYPEAIIKVLTNL